MPRRSHRDTDDSSFPFGRNFPFGENSPFGPNFPFGRESPFGPNFPFGRESPFGSNFPFGRESPFGPNFPFGRESPFGQDFPFGRDSPFRPETNSSDPEFPFERAMGPNDRIFYVNGDQYNIRVGGHSQTLNSPPHTNNPRNSHNNPPNPNPPSPAGSNDNLRRGRRPPDQRPKAKQPNANANRNPRSSALAPYLGHRENDVSHARSAAPNAASPLKAHHLDGGDNNRNHPTDIPPSDHNHRGRAAAAVSAKSESANAARIDNWREDVAAHPLPRGRPVSPNLTSTFRSLSTESSITLSSTDGPVKQPFLHHYAALRIDRAATTKRLDDEHRAVIQGLDGANPDDQLILEKLKNEYEIIVEVINNFTTAQCVGWIDEVSFLFLPYVPTLTSLQAPAPDDPNKVESRDPDIYYIRLLRRDDPDESCSDYGISVHPNDRRISGMRPLKFDAYDKSKGKRNIQLPWDETYYHHWGDVLPVRILPVQEDDMDGYFNRYELSLKERERFHRGSEAYFADNPSPPKNIWCRRGTRGTLFTLTFNPKLPARTAHPKLFTDLHDLFADRFKGR